MVNKDYYNYYEILFSLRKEYLKNQEIINKLLSYVKINNNKYDSNIIFKPSGVDKADSLLLIISKRQSQIESILKSIHHHIVEYDHDLEKGKYLYVFRLSDNYVSLLDGNQDGRYLNSHVSITDPKEFIELYKLLNENIICKNGNTYLIFEREYLIISNNGLNLFYKTDNNKFMNLDYNAMNNNISIDNNSYINTIMELKIDKDKIPAYYRNLIDKNMDDYLYTIENNNKGLYKVEDNDNKLILKPNNKH